jgi:allene oxide cyclase
MLRAVSLTAALAGLAALPAGAQAAPPSHSFIELTKVDAVDVGPAGDSLGDMQVFTFTVRDRAGGRRTGGGHGYGVRVEVGVARDCLANWSLPGGRIVLQWESHDGERAARAAIVGGTGRYRHQTGDVKLTST